MLRGRQRKHASRPTIALLGATLLLAGCGYSRTAAPSPGQPAMPGAMRTLSYPHAGLRFRAPKDWTVWPGHGRLVTTVSSGAAVVSVWRYPRSQPAPADRAGLQAAAQQLLGSLRGRDPSLQLIRAQVTVVSGVPVVQLSAFETIGNARRRVRSTHLFLSGTELVIEEYAPPSLFHSVDHAVFSPLLHSVSLSAKPAA